MEIVVLIGLIVILAVVAAALLWQERRRVPEPGRAVVYSVEDGLEYVWANLSDEARARLGRGDVRRIIEWEMHYLQHPRIRDENTPAVVGGVEAAEYVQRRALEQGHPYDADLIFAVLDRQAEFLAAIGAVGEPAEEPGRSDA